MHHCPYVVQRTIIDHFDQWKSNQALCAKLWEDKNAIFMLEVSRQCCQLPVTFASTVRKSIHLYRHWFVVRKTTNIQKSHSYLTFIDFFSAFLWNSLLFIHYIPKLTILFLFLFCRPNETTH
jgi:hypothetical protein